MLSLPLGNFTLTSASQMSALRLVADWDPRSNSDLGEDELRTRMSRNAAQVWRHPRARMVSLPVPELADDEVLIRVRVCGVCGSDAHCVQADEDGYVAFSGPARLPVTLGHEFAGEVVKTGRLVKSVRLGDAVTAESVAWCGVCDSCRGGRPNQCANSELLGFTRPGAFAEFVAVKEYYCWSLDPLRTSYSESEIFEIGSLIEPIGCAYNGMFVDAGGFQPGAFVAVFGAGPIGLSAIMLARAAGAAKVFAFEPSQARRDLAERMGADIAFDSNSEKPSTIIRELTGRAGADLVVEAAGAASETIPEVLASLAPNGKMVFLGRHDTVSVVDFNPIVTRANALIGARGHAGQGTFRNVIRLLAAGRLPAREMITSRYKFADALRAIDHAASREHGKILVEISDRANAVVPDLP